MFIQQAKSVMPTLWIVAITNRMVQAGQMQVQSKVKKVTQVIKVLKARLELLVLVLLLKVRMIHTRN